MRLATAEQMRNLDKTAIQKYEIPGMVLMENAGKGTVDCVAARYGDLKGLRVAVVVGPGNNGGDGLVIARHLHQRGAFPLVYLLVKSESLQGDAAANLAIVLHLPVPLTEILDDDALEHAEQELHGADYLVDAIFGTGLKRDVLGFFAAVVQMVNRFSGPVIAVDIPSGLDADTGHALGECVQADLTVTYGLAKPGHVLQPGAGYTGELQVVDIGIPPEAQEKSGHFITMLHTAEVAAVLPQRPVDGHKGVFGHLLVLAGSTGKTGAAILTALGALRSGVGLVTLAVPSDLNQIFETSLPEAMTVPLTGSDNGAMSIASLDAIHALLDGKKAVTIGPGLGTGSETADLVATLYREVRQPMVVDADGLNVLSGHSSLFSQCGGPRILTPHPGEMAHILKTSVKDIQSNRIACARDFAAAHGVVVVLKGARTVLADPNGRVAINPTGNAGMGTGGMGDVLSGIIGSLLAQGVEAWEAACTGVFVHGMAGDRLQEKWNADYGFLASELAGEIPCVLREIRHGNKH